MKISMSRREVIVTACLAGIAAWAVPSMAAPLSFKVSLTGAQQVPPVKTAATGTAASHLDDASDIERAANASDQLLLSSFSFQPSGGNT